MNRLAIAAAVLIAASLPACSSQSVPDGMPGDAGDDAPFSAIAEDETVRFTGTEPFWGGQVRGRALTYATPDNPDGADIAVTRFAGRGGVSWSGTLGGERFVLAVAPGYCSDGMSDRTYPFAATLDAGGEQRSGCAWSEQRPFSEGGEAARP